MKPSKKPSYKRGDRVLYFTDGHYSLTLWDAEVTAVRQQSEGHWIVHTRSHGQLVNGYWSKRFSTKGFEYHPGNEICPIWQLRPFTNADDFENLKKRAETASRRFKDYRSAEECMEREVHSEASSWEIEERTRRRELIPDVAVLKNTLARMGFRQPRQRRAS